MCEDNTLFIPICNQRRHARTFVVKQGETILCDLDFPYRRDCVGVKACCCNLALRKLEAISSALELLLSFSVNALGDFFDLSIDFSLFLRALSAFAELNLVSFPLPRYNTRVSFFIQFIIILFSLPNYARISSMSTSTYEKFVRSFS